MTGLRLLFANATLAFCALVAGAPAPVAAQQAPSTAVAIVVHPNVQVNDISFDELRRIFRGERQFWPDKSRITLLVRAPVAQERKLVLQKIYRMSEDAFRQYWIAKMFRAEVASGPKLVYSSEMARELIGAIPGAIGFMPATSVIPGVKVIRIDGRLPSDPGYPLK